MSKSDLAATHAVGTPSPSSPSIRAWLGVFSLALGAALIVTTEFTPVGFLPNVSRDLDVSLGTAGLMVLVPGLSATIAVPLVIVGAGRLDRRLLIVTLGVLVLLSNAIAAVSPNFAVVVLARVFLGVAIGGFWAVVPPLGFRLAGQQAGTRATSIILAGLSAGTVIGLPAGQFFGNLIGWRLTFAAAAALAVLIVIGQLAVLPEIPPAGRMTFAHLGAVFRVPIGRTVLIAGGIATTGQFAASTFVTPFLLQNARLSSDFATLLFIGYGLAGIVGTLVGPVLVERDRMLTFVGAAAAFGVVLAVLPAVAGAPVVVSILIGTWGVLWGLVPLALQTHMLTVTPDAPEAASAIFITVMQLAIAVGSGLGGVLVDSAGLTAVFVISGLTAIVSACFAVLARHGV
ncbi:MFS transporter [Planotetraspora thailandica]|uniref:MFS transporter n=1 Tax=Planotetraspora thailandica TaxID=487172 RepID=A0A8J3Y1S3_9ACTN|nr:MFS transporter [Planotetraspora thailandica]GII59288.1 MFS transporter [Planotetraspora thailandica]